MNFNNQFRQSNFNYANLNHNDNNSQEIRNSFLAQLKSRQLLRDITADFYEPDFIKDFPTMYVGFDPTASSLHVGSLVVLLAMDRFRQAGGQIIVLLGGATALIGDPSGKNKEREMVSEMGIVDERINCLTQQIRSFFSKTNGLIPIFLNNADWHQKINTISFLQNVGKHFTIAQMMAKDSVKNRMENGISFAEFSYQLLQAYDFQYILDNNNCTIQMGGSDQWGNILAGIDLIKKNGYSKKVPCGLTLPLLTNSAGKKYGKSESGTIWLDPKLTSPYYFYQFWLKTSDEDVEKFLLWLTDFSLEDIGKFMKIDEFQRVPQKHLAFWLTNRVHGCEIAEMVETASKIIFSGECKQASQEVVNFLSTIIPSLSITCREQLSIEDVLVKLGAVNSKSEARRLIKAGGFYVDGKSLADWNSTFNDYFEGEIPAVLISVGKTRKFLILLNKLEK